VKQPDGTFPELGEALRHDFPIFAAHPGLVYLDNAATTHKPRSVITATSAFYEHDNANVSRGLYDLAERATERLSSARSRLARFVGAASPDAIVFTAGATAALNLVASGFGEAHLEPGDRVLLSPLEHHANLVPWQRAAARSGAKLEVLAALADATPDLSRMEERIAGA
jgi:selenocysteine lyase/cysteine desulfurase